jgi:DNA polymerase elongation subunit (family B)
MDIHIFDAIARDQRVVKETEEGLEVDYTDLNDDDFYGWDNGRPNYSTLTPARKMEYMIQLFGTTAEGKQVHIEVEGFRPFLFLGLPVCKTPTEEYKWKNKVEEKIRADIGESDFRQMTFEKVTRQKLFGYTGGKAFPFLRVSVPSMALYRKLKKVVLTEESYKKERSSSAPSGFPRLKVDGRTIEVYEANIDPMLRFFHVQNLQTCGWIRIDEYEINSEDPCLKVTSNWADIKPCAQPPRPVAPFRIVTWDIECNSSDGSFPMAKQGYRRVAKQLWALCSSAAEVPDMLKKGFQGLGPLIIPPLKTPGVIPRIPPMALTTLWEGRDDMGVKEKEERIVKLTEILDKCFGASAPIAGDPIIQIGSVTYVDGVKERHVFVLGGCDPIDGIVIHSSDTEEELLIDWFTWITEEDFDIFIGYNTSGFDEKYTWHRLEELGLEEREEIQRMTRIFDTGGVMKLEEKRLSSAALGDNFLYLWTTPGRLRIDLLGHIRRKAQLPSYKLDSVCAVYLSGKLTKVESVEGTTWKLITKQTGDARVGRFVQMLDELGEDLTDKMEIVGVEKGSHILVSTEEDLSLVAAASYSWAVVKDDISPADIFRMHRGTNADRAKVAAYCVQDCDLTFELYSKLEVFNEVMSMANVCSVPVSYIFNRGQGIKIESLIFKDCMERGQLIQVLPSGVESSESYEGAFVLAPNPGFYTSPVGVCDFASLYPSTIISENISYDMLVWVKDFDLDGDLVGVSYGSVDDEKNAPPGTQWTDIEFDIIRPVPGDTRKQPEKKKTGTRICRYAQPADDKKGTLPQIVAKLLAARKAKRKEITQTSDVFKKSLLDAEQNAYKITANSLYGQLGSGTFKIRLQHLAASVTAYGRKQIMFSKSAIEKFYGPEAGDPRCSAEIVYGDTDSIFVNFNPRAPDGRILEGREAIVATMELTEEAGKFITGALKAPHDFEYDKTFYPFIIFSKKRYVGNKYEESPDDYKETSMGIVLKRRDNAPLLKMIYGAAIQQLLLHKDVVAATEVVKQGVRDLVEGKITMSQLTITKSLKSDYKGTPPAHKMLADRIAVRDPGNAPASGERIGYVYVKPHVGQLASKLQGERIETPTFILKNGLQTDYEYYILHQLMNPLMQLFGIFVEKMPGFTPPSKWEEGDRLIGQRESIASEILFRDGLNACNNLAKKAFLSKMGVATETKASTVKKPVTMTSVIQVSQKRQSSIASFLSDSLLASSMRKARKETPST